MLIRGAVRELDCLTMSVIAARSRLSLAACAVALVLAAPAEAAETRYVASNGSNTNNCTLNAPCRTLQRAVNQAPSNGEVIVLDSGHFGNSLNINKSITISADGVTATLLDPGGITIDNADAVVVLRGLHLKQTGTFEGSDIGIRVSNAEAVHIDRCTIENFSFRGISFAADDAQLFVTDSIVRNNIGSGLLFSATDATLTIDNSRFENNSVGIAVGEGQATVTRSIVSDNSFEGIGQSIGRMNVTWTTASHNGSNGYRAYNGGQMTLESSVARDNGTGLRASVGSRARVSRSTFTDNGIGIGNEGVVQTLQNNIHRGNGTNLANSGTITTPAPF